MHAIALHRLLEDEIFGRHTYQAVWDNTGFTPMIFQCIQQIQIKFTHAFTTNANAVF